MECEHMQWQVVSFVSEPESLISSILNISTFLCAHPARKEYGCNSEQKIVIHKVQYKAWLVCLVCT